MQPLVRDNKKSRFPTGRRLVIARLTVRDANPVPVAFTGQGQYARTRRRCQSIRNASGLGTRPRDLGARAGFPMRPLGWGCKKERPPRGRPSGFLFQKEGGDPTCDGCNDDGSSYEKRFPLFELGDSVADLIELVFAFLEFSVVPIKTRFNSPEISEDIAVAEIRYVLGRGRVGGAVLISHISPPFAC